jgi:hypothetical protein
MGTTNSKPPRPIKNTEPRSGPIYYTLFLEVHNCVAPFTRHGIGCTNLVQKKQFPELNWHILTFSQQVKMESRTVHWWRCSKHVLILWSKKSLFWLELLKKNIFLFVFETFKPSLYIIKITNKDVPHKKSWLKATQILKYMKTTC